jgi:hypothetical protein
MLIPIVAYIEEAPGKRSNGKENAKGEKEE